MNKDKKPLILIVEDSKILLAEIKSILRKNNYRTISVNDGIEALSFLKREVPDLILIDIVMSKMDGYHLCKNIKKNKMLKDIPVVLLDYLSEPKEIAKGLESGADNFIIKPFDEEYLILSLQYILNRKVIGERRKLKKDFGYFSGGCNSKINSNVVDIIFSIARNIAKKNIELNQTKEELRKVLVSLKNSQNYYQDLFENSSNGICISPLEGKPISINQTLVKILGYDNKEEILSSNILEKLIVFNNFKNKSKSENRIFEKSLKRKDGSNIWVEVNSKTILNKKPIYYQCIIIRDITEQKRIEEELKYLSFHDSLTGLYNRRYFEEELKRLNSSRQLPLSIIMGDLDNLKLINDTFGYKEGDNFIIIVAEAMKNSFREEDIIARRGGDEFFALLPKTTYKEAQKILDRLKKNCKKLNNLKISLSISFGITTKTNIDQNIYSLVKEAEDKMFKEKKIKLEKMIKK